MLIRRMILDDLEAVVALEHVLFSSPWNYQDFEHDVFHNTFASYYVMEDHNHILGYGGMWIAYEQAQITTIGVDQEYQGQGIGRSIMQAMIDEAMSKKCEVMTLEVRISNHQAISLYESLGFEKQAIRKGYYQDNHEDAYLMMKRMEEMI